MSRYVVKAPGAVQDLRKAAEYLRQQSPRSALRFLDDAEDVFRRLAEMPGIGTPYDPNVPAFHGLRYLVLKKFRNYVVLYVEDQDILRILHVLHGARDIHGLLADEVEADGDPETNP